MSGGKETRLPGDSRGRILFLKVLFISVFAVIAGRLVQVQVFESERYRADARRQYEDKLEIRATRGAILDREGRPLVSTATVASVAADPRMLGANADPLARHLAGILREPLALIKKKLSARGTNFVWIARRVDPAVAAKIDRKRFPGVIVTEDPKRVYHYDDLAGQLLGFTDLDCRGISGLELQFDASLRGADGYEIRMRDGLGRAKPALEYPRVEAVDGEDLVLTIDLDYQAIAEEALRRGVEESEAESGLVVMMDPGSGEILAMANYPRLHPARAGTVERGVTRNRAVTDMFEPGSVFKIVTASAAIEHGLVRPSDTFFAENGSYRVPLPRGKFRTITDTHEYGTITFREAVEVSSNIVMAKVSDRVGAEMLYRSARDFGFGTETGVELPGEIRGELKKPTDWSGTTLNTMSYGYEVGVTPLQIAAAYCVIANGGTLYRPTIVLRHQGNDTRRKPPQAIRRVVSQETATTLNTFFVGVVERGTGVGARVEGVSIAGKTGTARK
ncbi:MAG: penicillin-binding protein 2, partial [Ignavibacteria bacterium]|nr:penicillin-binding protein 2 [Ignavibacteria bacterium]